jgi:hypothetical protein
MKGCARTCLLWLVTWAAAAGALYVHLRPYGFLDPQIFWASGIGGLLFTMATAYAFNIETARRERRVLLDAMTGVRLEDGKWVAVSGPIRALSPLQSPLSGTPVVAYAYKIDERRRTSKGSSILTVYEGKAITPSTIATRHGAVRLLAVPAFDLPWEGVSVSTARERAIEYVNATQFQTTKTPKDKRTTLDNEWTDDDGKFRVDKSSEMSTAVDWDEAMFEEQLVKQGEIVCAFGLYSQQKGGLVPHPNWAHHCRIMRGDAESVAAKLRTRMKNYAIGVAICGALVYGIVTLYRHAALSSF